MTKNIDEILQLTIEEFVIKGCTEGLKTRDYFKIKNTLLKYEEYEDNQYYKKMNTPRSKLRGIFPKRCYFFC